MLKNFEYSKLIIIFETILISILTIGVLLLVWYSVSLQFDGAFPYLTTMVSVAWGAYGTSAAFYYNKAKTENKIKLINAGADKDVVMAEPYIKNKADISFEEPEIEDSLSEEVLG